jgi:DNA-binding CsgD family transcriptional regulator
MLSNKELYKMYLSDPDAASLTETPGQLEYVLRNKHRYEPKPISPKRDLKRKILELIDQGLNQDDIAIILGASISYVKSITSSQKPYSRKDILIARALGKTIAQIASEFNISIGSVQNYLKTPKKLYKREDIESGAITYYESIAKAMQYNSGLTANIIKKQDVHFGYKFSVETNTSNIDPLTLE